jgi:hypothetical protein
MAVRNRSLLILICLAWIMLVVSLYFASHKPFSPEQAIRIARLFWQLAVVSGLAALGGGIGRRLCRRTSLQGLAAPPLQAALGLGLLSLALLGLGGLGSLHPAWILPVFAALAVFLGRDILDWLSSLRMFTRLWQESDTWGRAMAGGLGFILFLTLAVALAPPLKFDALVYHLALPRLYLSAGRVSYTPENIFWGMPQAGELLYTGAMALAGDPAAAALGWLAGVLAIGGLAGYLLEGFGARAAWAGTAALLCGGTLLSALSWAYVEWWSLLFGLGMLVSLTAWRCTGQRRDLLLGAAFAGLALGTKYTAGAALLAGLGVVLWAAPCVAGEIGSRAKMRAAPPMAGEIGSGAKMRGALSSGALFALAAAAVSLPWWLKNFMGSGSPFYPFFFPAGAMDRFRLDFYHSPAWGGWQEALLLPFRATFLGADGAPGYSASIGPLLLALAPLSALQWRQEDRLKRLSVHTAALAALIGLLVWAAGGRLSMLLIQSRLYVALFPAFALLAGAGFAALDELRLPGLRVGRVAGALVGLVFGFSLFQVGTVALKTGAAGQIFGLRPEGAYLEANLGWYARAMGAVRDLPAGSKVLMLWEARSYYCAPSCHPDEILDRWLHDFNQAGSAGAVRQDWRRQGYTHLLVYKLGMDFIRQDDRRYEAEDWQALDGLLGELPEPVDFGGAYQLYALP